MIENCKSKNGQQLISAVDYILNSAGNKEMEVIVEAVERRLKELNNPNSQ